VVPDPVVHIRNSPANESDGGEATNGEAPPHRQPEIVQSPGVPTLGSEPEDASEQGLLQCNDAVAKPSKNETCPAQVFGHVPSPDTTPANGGDKDEGVQNAIATIGEALPHQQAEIVQNPDRSIPGGEGESESQQKELEFKDAVAELSKNETLPSQHVETPSSSEDGREEESWENDKKNVQNMQSLARRMDSSLQNAHEPEPLSDAPREVQAEYVSMYITTCLNVALPTKPRLSKLVYKPPNFLAPNPGTVSKSTPAGRNSTPGNPPEIDAPPPPAETELKIFQTWDKRLYANLPRLNSKSIRVVEILPGNSEKIAVELTQKTLEEITNNYEALSYVWGAPTPKRIITVNNIEVLIQPNLFDALKSLRLTDAKRMIWIDALCINQTSMRERSIEVRKMGEIYREAKTVAVFLGAPSTPASSIGGLFKFLRRHEDSQVSQSSGNRKSADVEEFEASGVDKHTVCKGFVELCLRPWWSRVWVMQEFYLATEEPVWYWGSSCVGNAALKRDMQLLMSTSWSLYSLPMAASNSKFSSEVQGMIKKSISLFRSDVERINQMISRRAPTHGFDIPSRLYCELSAQASNPRDYVYGLREIFDPRFRKVFLPDYLMGVELLFACLAVFLIQFEAWSDVLWWYPDRFKDIGREQLPSWLPDFTRRIKPTESELLPRDHMKSRRNEPRLVVLNHALHADGYILDKLVAHMHLDKSDGYEILRQIWEFDAVTNSKMGVDKEVNIEEQQNHPLLQDFLKVCDNAADECNILDEEYRTSPVNPPKGPVLDWTSRHGFDKPTHMHLALPFFDILWYHAYKDGDDAILRLKLLEDDEPSLLDRIFDSEMDHVFRRTLAKDFITACVLDWPNFDIVLDRLMERSQWSKPEHPRWSGADANFSDVRPFLIQITGDLVRRRRAWGRPLRFSGLIFAVLLGCKSQASFMRVVSKLKSAANDLHDIAEDFKTRAHVEQLKVESDTVATRVVNYDAIVAKYQGRVLFCTNMGFRGLSSPGVEGCGTTVALLDGLSFPVVLNDDKDYPGRHKLVGCAIVNGVDMQSADISKVKVPAGLDLGEKIVFKIT
jgi:hypothetical protein